MAEALIRLQQQWRLLQELAGEVNPFVDRVREQIEQAVAADHQEALERVRLQHQEELTALRLQLQQEATERIAGRLAELVERAPHPEDETTTG